MAGARCEVAAPLAALTGTCIHGSIRMAVARCHSSRALGVMSVTPQILNAAMQAYVHTFPNRKSLAEHIDAAGLTEQRDEIIAKLDAVLKTAEDYLYSFPGGVSWGDAFVRDYHALLRKQHLLKSRVPTQTW